MVDFAFNGRTLRNAVIGSLVGGAVFGMLMQMMDMIGMVGMIVRSDNVAVAWMVHMAISAIFGVVLGLLLMLGFNPIVTGLAWGMMAWIGGALILMPLFLGMPGKVFDLSGSTPWFSLMGHMMYGLVAGLVVWALARRNPSPVRSNRSTRA